MDGARRARARTLVAAGVGVAALVAAGATPSATSVEASGVARWFGERSPLNVPIPTDADVDPRSPAMVAGLVHAAERKGWAVSASRWTVSVYYAAPRTPRRNVRLTASWRPRDWMLGVPIPPAARPDPAGDAHMAVIDPRRRCFYELYGASRASDGSWTAEWANRGSTAGNGIQPWGLSTRASGFANLAGLVRPAELAEDAIRHALVFGYPFSKAGGPVRPATASDGRPATESGAATGTPRPPDVLPVPQGARVQLDPALDLDALALEPWQRTIARALQVYGMYLGDTAGALALYAVGRQSWPGNPYARYWGDAAYAYLPTELVRHLRVLELPPQYAPRPRVAGSRCSRMPRD
jgi:hypothetical protein